LDKNYNEYLEKSKELGIDEFNSGVIGYYNKINITKIDEFKKIGIDVTNVINHGLESYLPIPEEFLLFPVIFVGTVTETEVPEKNAIGLKSSALIRVNSYFKGDYYFDNPPKFFNIYFYSGYDSKNGKQVYELSQTDFRRNGNTIRGILNKGDQLLILFDKHSYKSLSDESKSKYPSDFDKINVSSIAHYYIINKNNKLIDNILYDDIADFYSDKGDTVLSKENVEYYRDLIQSIEKINDTPNFYNRSYK